METFMLFSVMIWKCLSLLYSYPPLLPSHRPYLQHPHRYTLGGTETSSYQPPKRDWKHIFSVQFSSVAQSCASLCDPVDYSTPGFPVHHQILELTQTHVHQVYDAIQPSHPLSCPSLSTFNLFQHQGLFQWLSSSHQVAKVLEFQLQHQSFQWIFKTDYL